MRNILIRLCLAAASAAVSAGPVLAAPLAATPTPDPQAIEAVFTGISPNGPGCAAGVEQNGRTLLTRAWGLADLAEGRPLTPTTRFYMASVSKQVAALTVMEAVRAGRMSLKGSITTYIPELPGYLKEITLYDLLTHTSGVRDYFALAILSGADSQRTFTEKSVISAVSRQKSLNFPRGTRFLYSNSGYVLLAIAAERATGQSFDSLARRELFTPLGMGDTFFQHHHEAPVPEKAHGYEPKGDGWAVSDSSLDVVGDGGLYSNVTDMLKWVANFDSGSVGAASLAQMTVPARTQDGKLTGYGMGLMVGETHGLKVVEHGGALAGYRTADLWLPSEKFGVVVLCNFASADPTHLARRLAALYLPALADAPAQVDKAGQPAYAPDPATMAASAGTYVSEAGASLKITLDNGRLVVASLGAPLVPEGPGAFSVGAASSGRRVVFSPETSPTYFDLFMGERPAARFVKAFPQTPDAKAASSFPGDYFSPELDVIYRIGATPSGFTLAIGSGEPLALESIGKDRFLVAGLGAEVALLRRKSGTVRGFSVAYGRVKGIAFARTR